jgi:hypothetical protein
MKASVSPGKVSTLTTLQAAWDFIDQCAEEITIRKTCSTTNTTN